MVGRFEVAPCAGGSGAVSKASAEGAIVLVAPTKDVNGTAAPTEEATGAGLVVAMTVDTEDPWNTTSSEVSVLWLKGEAA